MAKEIIGYAAVFRNAGNNMYYVEFPDLKGCYTQGDSLEAAISKAQEALIIYYRQNEGKLPAASNLEEIKKKYPDVLVQIIVINTNNCFAKSLSTVKKTLTIPAWLNELSEKYHVNFSKVLKNALIQYLSNLDTISVYDKNMLDS